MDEDNLQFDALLGGSEELPPVFTLEKFVSYRTQEIQHMRSTLLSQSGSKLAFQTLPKHMRRRAMSHNVKRLPRRLRQIHINQMKKSGMPSKTKRPSRKYRRRPRNLMEEYTKRSSKKYKWLQTHIWHAKRFHITEKWGYKLPLRPCDRSFRACYRAVTEHCLLQDISYVNCVEISGNKLYIIEKMKELSKSNSGLSIGARAFIGGNREGELTLYEGDHAVGTINYHWEPNSGSKLWLWIHAAFYVTALNLLIKHFNLISDGKNPEHVNLENGIKLRELMEELCRFRLTGPLANLILQSALIVFDNNPTNSSQAWLQNYLQNPSNKKVIDNQLAYWKSVISLSDISPHLIVSLIVKDPRINLPKKRTKSLLEFEKTKKISTISNLSSSPLWNEETRKELNEYRFTSSKIIDLQSDLLIPGSDLTNYNAFVPIMLVQKPGNKTEFIGMGSGWDVIAPSGWAKSFWIALIMRGARAGGLRESQSVLFEMGKSEFLYPDTKAGVEEENHISADYTEKFFRRPPNKRINYTKFNIVSPFKWNWKLLIKEWNSDPVDEFVVLRDLGILNSINLLLNSKTKVKPELPRNSLIPVKLECEKRGNPTKFALICLPQSENDLKNLVENKSVDKNKTERKELRQSHKLVLKRLKKKTKLKPNVSKVSKELLINYAKKMRELWLPEATTVRWSCSREVIGFVRYGGFSLSHGKSFASGYIVANALSDLIKLRSKNKVLFRNTNTRQYRTAKLSVIVD